MKICVYARIADGERMLRKVSFYSVDIQILRELGHEVVTVTAARQIPLDCDLYYIFWAGWGALPLALCKLNGRPNLIVSALHYHDVESGYFTKAWYKRAIVRWSVRHTDAFLAVSQIEYEGCRLLGARNPQMLYHAVTIPADSPGWAARENIVFSIGHLNSAERIARKGFENVVRAIPMVAQAIPDIHFVMAGTIGSGFVLDKLAKELGVGDRVTFPGQIENCERDRYFSRSRVLAQPSAYEGFGVAQAEAMAYGLPVVSSRGGAVPEVLGDAGVYCDKNDPSNIANNIISVLSDQPAWEELSRRGRARAERLFSCERRKSELRKIIEYVVSRK